MNRDELVVDILTDLVEERLEIQGYLFEAEVATDPHASPDTAKTIQAGALAAGRTAGVEAKAAGLDRNGGAVCRVPGDPEPHGELAPVP